MNLGPLECQHLERSQSLEWLEPNGRSGFACGSVSGASTRRFHGLLLVAKNPPHDRVMLVNHLEERLTTAEGTFTLSTYLRRGEPASDGYRRCVGFSARPGARWRYAAGQAQIERAVLCPRGRDAVVIRYRLLNAPEGPARLLLRPMLTGRAADAVIYETTKLNTGFTAGPGRVAWQPDRDLPAVTAFFRGEYRHAPAWVHGVDYPVDRARGLEGKDEDWWSPGEIEVDLSAAREVTVVLTTEALEEVDGAAWFQAEEARRYAAIPPPSGDLLFDDLRVMSEAYLSQAGDHASVIAGYPWFEAWTRDTFTALPGLCLVTGRFELARRIIETFARMVDGGMLPNNLPVEGAAPRWNAMDASLWFIVAVDRYLRYTGDEETVRRAAWPAIRSIVEGYRHGTRYGIRVDADGLVTGSAPDTSLTWMDGQFEGKVMTPRRGKPVEVQGLWVRALDVTRRFAERFGEAEQARRAAADLERAIASFRRRFWYERGGYLYDVIDGPEGDDARLRPNQVFAIALTPFLVEPAQARRALGVVRERLLTPVGLRTLDRIYPDYHPRYEGSRAERDPAYHQGTVWPFLLGPFITAWVRAHGGTEAARREARGFLDGIQERLWTEACMGHICEIFDAEPPHRPRGCFAQAWSPGEILRALAEDVLGRLPCPVR